MKRVFYVFCVCMLLSMALAETAEMPRMLRVVDPEGEPVEGVFLSLCTESACIPEYTDDLGIVYPEDSGQEYIVHIISTPEGYVAEFDMEYVFAPEDTLMEIVLTKDQSDGSH